MLRFKALEETKMNQVRIITELEKEKKKMQDDVLKLKEAKVNLFILQKKYRVTSVEQRKIWVSNRNESHIARSLEHPTVVRELISSIPVRESDFISLSHARDTMIITSFSFDVPSFKFTVFLYLSESIFLKVVYSNTCTNTSYLLNCIFTLLSKTARRWEKSSGRLSVTLEEKIPWQVGTTNTIFFSLLGYFTFFFYGSFDMEITFEADELVPAILRAVFQLIVVKPKPK